MNYQNKTIFYIPIKLNQFTLFCNELLCSGIWKENEEQTTPSYLLPYVSKISRDRDLYRSFLCKEFIEEELFSYKEWLQLKNHPKLKKIRLSIFSTNIAFMEYWFEYPDKDVSNDMMEFAYWFKKAKPKNEWVPAGQKSLFNYSLDLLPKTQNYKLFFTNEVDFKCECKCFHTLQIRNNSKTEEELNNYCHRLARNYNSTFPSAQDVSENDIIYIPYTYDIWAGSPDALANVVINDGEETRDRFINGHMYEQILSDHQFIFLLLLNQRFSLLNYLNEVASNAKDSKKQLDLVSKESMLFKTTFSFRIISDDLLYQSIYSKMYHVMNIDKLIEDTVDNERQADTLISKERAQSEENLSVLLLGLSFLSLFSALTDASGFFDRIIFKETIATWLSVICVFVIFVICLIKIIKEKQ